MEVMEKANASDEPDTQTSLNEIDEIDEMCFTLPKNTPTFITTTREQIKRRLSYLLTELDA
ncbi:hypothetical protein N7493_000863 [Penicillium malachiteum]|uniref:Uncharacterized protein n=1 Tax=Penicillium malachiteum TaxID=1324776 RepID=A0AAD6HXQ5_9EURO|nr:hypothetical protein N7493_000863 [Penicillium malachiteum]